MRYRKLRIAWSVAWGACGVLLVGLWVRSYWKWDSIQKSTPTYFVSAFSNSGELRFHYNSTPAGIVEQTSRNIILIPPGVAFHSDTASEFRHFRERDSGFVWYRGDLGTIGGVPHWFPVVLIAVVARMPWFRWRYSLRTMFVVLTLAAVGLGWVVYAIRN